MRIKDILAFNNAHIYQGNPEDYLTNLSKDTRTICKGETYIGIKGEVYDGSMFYQEAINKGAKTLILNDIPLDKEYLKDKDVNIIIVDDTTEYLINLAKRKRTELKIPIIAVTGSVGKTSTKNMISDILATKYKVLKTKGNLNTKIGLALTILSIKDEEIAVLEMGMNQKGEISILTNIAKPDIAVITNVGTAHIGNLGSRENILQAKLEILEGLNGPILINNDNDLLHAWRNRAQIKNKIITYGLNNSSDYQASNLKFTKEGSIFTLNNQNITLNVLGRHSVYNALVAYAIGDLFQVPIPAMIKKFQNLTSEAHRLEIINNNHYTIIDDTYNASYDSVVASLEILGHFLGRKIAVLGDILELGEYGKDIHHKLGKFIVANHIDILITVGDLAQNINETAVSAGFIKANSYHFSSNKEASNFINNNKEENDVYLLKASNGMHFIEILNNIKGVNK